MNSIISKILPFFFLISTQIFAEDYFDKITGLTFPEYLDGFTLVREKDQSDPRYKFEDSRLGYSIAYSSNNLELTFYAFTGGATDIKDGISGKWVKYFFEQGLSDLKAYEELGYYRNIKTFPVGKEFSFSCPTFFLGNKLTYTIVDEESEQRVRSFLFCCGINQQILKIRATGNDGVDFEESLSKFLKFFADQIDSRNKEEHSVIPEVTR